MKINELHQKNARGIIPVHKKKENPEIHTASRGGSYFYLSIYYSIILLYII